MDTVNKAGRVPNWLADLGIKEGEYFCDSKHRYKRGMKSPVMSEAGRIWCCLALHTSAFQQELAVKMVSGKREPLRPGDIARETGIPKQNIRRGLKQLEPCGVEVRGTSKNKIEIYVRMVPRVDSEARQKTRNVIPRDYHFEGSDDEAAELTRLFKAFKIHPSAGFKFTRDYILEVTAAYGNYENARNGLRAVLARARASDAIRTDGLKSEMNRARTADRTRSTAASAETVPRNGPDSDTEIDPDLEPAQADPGASPLSDSIETEGRTGPDPNDAALIAEACGLDLEAAARIRADVLAADPTVTTLETIQLINMKQREIRAAVKRGTIASPVGYLIIYVPKMAKSPQMVQRARELARPETRFSKAQVDREVLDPSNPWDQIRQHLSTVLTPGSYTNWFVDTFLIGITAKTLEIGVPDDETRCWLETEYIARILETIQQLKLPFSGVSFQVRITDSVSEEPG
jgi:hypothetical protein